MVARVMEWLEEEAGPVAGFGFALLAAMVIVSLQQMTDAALTNWGLVPAKTGEYTNPFEYMNGFMLFDIFGLSPFLEELFFRIVPLTIVVAFVSKSPKVLFGAALVFAILFGSIHPYALSGKIDVAIGGFFFGLVFLKCGGLNKHFLNAGLFAVLAHSLTNILILSHGYWEYLMYKS